jgi:hypothetical protein
MPQIYSVPSHCPGFDNFKDMESFTCQCPKCGEKKEIFSDEFDKPQSCGKCQEPIDFSQCTLEGSAKSADPR